MKTMEKRITVKDEEVFREVYFRKIEKGKLNVKPLEMSSLYYIKKFVHPHDLLGI